MLNSEENSDLCLKTRLNTNKLTSKALKFSNQWSYLKTMKEVREYALSHVDVEDFKSTTGGL